MTLKELQTMMLKHLEESQEIRDTLKEHGTDLKWLKRAFWTLVTLVGTDLTAHWFKGH